MRKFRALSFLILNIFITNSFAVELSAPKPPILTLTTLNKDGTLDKSINFNLAKLESMPVHTLKTETTWGSGVQTFEGVLVKSLLESISLTERKIIAYSLNDFQIEIPISDIQNYPIIIAYRQNGNYMPVRNKGPLRIIYPETDFPELNRPTIKNRWIWQLREIIIK